MNEDITIQLLKNIKEGDKSSFDKLVLLYEKIVYRVCHRFFNNEEDALDATQEVFLKVFRFINKYEGKSSFNTWIYRIAANTCISISDKKRKEKDSLIKIIYNWFNSFTQQSPETTILEKEEHYLNKEIVRSNLTKIPEIYRIPVILKDMEGMSLEKISEILEVPLGTVKSRINRGRAILHDKIVNGYKVNNI